MTGSFSAAERRYIASLTPRLGRIATVGADGTPHVVPVAIHPDRVRSWGLAASREPVAA